MESVRAREMIVRIVSGGVVSRILEDLSREDLDIFLSGLARDAMRGYAPISTSALTGDTREQREEDKSTRTWGGGRYLSLFQGC